MRLLAVLRVNSAGSASSSALEHRAAHLEHAAVGRPGQAVLRRRSRRGRGSTVRPMTATGTGQSGTPPSLKPSSSSHLSSARDRRLGQRRRRPRRRRRRRSRAGARRRTARCGARRSPQRRRGRSSWPAVIGARCRRLGSPAAYNRRRLSQRPMPAAACFRSYVIAGNEARSGSSACRPRRPLPTNGSSSSIRTAATTPPCRSPTPRRPASCTIEDSSQRLRAHQRTARPRPPSAAGCFRHRCRRARPARVAVELLEDVVHAGIAGLDRPTAGRRRPSTLHVGCWIRHCDWYPDRRAAPVPARRPGRSRRRGARRCRRTPTGAGRVRRGSTRRSAARSPACSLGGMRSSQERTATRRQREAARHMRAVPARRRRGARARPAPLGVPCGATSVEHGLPRRRRRLRDAVAVCRSRHLLGDDDHRERSFGRMPSQRSVMRRRSWQRTNRRLRLRPHSLIDRFVSAPRRRALLLAARRPRRSSGSRSRASARTQLPIAIARFRDEDQHRPVAVGHHPRRPRAQRRLPRRRHAAPASTRRSQPGHGASGAPRAADALVGRLGRRAWPTAASTSASSSGTSSRAAELGGQSNAVEAAELRLGAHRIADYIYEKLTGEKGVFSTRIAYVTRAGSRHTLRVADADGVNDQVALNSGQPIISPAWSPNGKELAYVSFEKPEGGGLRPQRRHRRAPGDRRLPRLEQRAGLVARRRRRLAVTLSRDGGSQLFFIGKNGDEPAPPRHQPGDRHRGRVLAPTAAGSTSPATAAAARRSTAWPAGGGNAERVTFAGSYNISPAISPDGRTLAYVTRSGNAFRLAVLDLVGPGRAAGARSPTPATTSIRASRRTAGCSSMPRGCKAAAC